MSGFISMVDGQIVIGGPVNIGANGPDKDIIVISNDNDTQKPTSIVWKKGETKLTDVEK